MINSVNNNKNIFLIDDDKSVTDMLSMLLESRGYKVRVASTGRQALENISNSTDLVLLDLTLPDENGFDVCRKLKQREDTSRIPIIILSARLFPRDAVECLYIGADDYLTKPFECEELIARMEAVTRRSAIFNGHNGGIVSKAEQEIIKELRHIIDNKLIVPFYQPIFKLDPFGLLGVEALSRPETETMLKNPDVLFKAAIQFGFYQELEMLAWEKAVEKASGHIGEEKLFLNCNPYIVENQNLTTIKYMFHRNKRSLTATVLEITERTAVVDFKVFYEHLKKFKDVGFQFAVDDVGGGFASLESIVETRPEIVKIDRHIVSGLCKEPFKESIVRFIVQFCKENGIISIAEGVETKEELTLLRKMGIDAVQGYYLYRPHPEINLEDYNQVRKIV